MNLINVDFGYSISSWILITLTVTFAVAFLLTAKSWHEARRSPYYFQRRQALQQMQSYSVVSLTLLMVTAIVMAYAYSPNITAAPRTALLTNAKPRITTARQQQVSSAATASPTASRTASFSSISTQAAAGKISNVVFASGINDNFEPVGARTVFGEGDFRLYATFDYADMEDGTTWQWVWRQNGQVVDGGEEVWNYGSDGPGWVYLQPENGFAEGDYSLEVYVGGQLQSQAAAEISASVANQ